jgi:prepilin peptidase CpaA
MLAQLFILVVLPLFLLAAALCDLTRYTIPNRLCAALALAFVLFALLLPLPLSVLGLHAAAGAAGLALGFALFALGWIGGGDAKLFAAIVLWLGFGDLAAYAAAAALFGGALTLTLLMLRQVPLPAALLGQGWILKLHDRRSGIPYGVALAAGAFAVLPHAAIFRLAAQG